MPIAFHPEPDTDTEVAGSTTTGAEGGHRTEGSASGAPDSRRDPLTERILARGDASVSATTYASSSDGDQLDLADRHALRRVRWRYSTSVTSSSSVDRPATRRSAWRSARSYWSPSASEP